MFSIIIPYYNGQRTLSRLLASLPEQTPVVVVDDRSSEPLQLQRPNTRVVRLAEKGYFTGAVNAGLRLTAGSDVLILNQDVWFSDDTWINQLAKLEQRYDLIGEGISGKHPAWPQGYIHGTFMYIKRAVINALGPLNERDYPLWGSTCEYQLRAVRQGFRAKPLKAVSGFHHARKKGQSYGSSIQQLLSAEPDKKGWFIRTPPMISVVISAYNYGRFLRDAVNSLIGGETSLGWTPGQTFQSFDIWIVDDASTDETPEIGAELADDWQGIHYFRRQQNGGTPAANNSGIKRAVGKYIAILCGDDMMAPGRLEYLYRAQEQNPHSLIYDDVQRFTDGEYTTVGRMENYDFDLLLGKNFIHAGIMFPRRAWEEVGGYPGAMKWGREDWAMNVRLGIHGYCGVRIPRAGYLYRRGTHNRTLRNTNLLWRDRFLLQMQTLFPNVYKGARPKMCCGGRKRRTSRAPANGGGAAARTRSQSLAVPEVGTAGMTLIEYRGGNYGTQTWFGAVTGARYVLGGSRRLSYVDNRDLHTNDPRRPGLLDIRENGRNLFAVRKITAGQIDLTPAEKGQVNQQPPVTQPEPVAPEPAEAAFPDPSGMTVGILKALISKTDLSPEQLQQMLAAEQAGKARKSALAALQSALETQHAAA